MNNISKITAAMVRAINRYDMIQNGDKIAVGVSGGKDSLMLIKCLKKFSEHSEIKFDVVGIMVDMFDGKYNYTEIKDFMKKIGVEFFVEKSQIKEIVFDIRKEKNPCSLCAKLRRGILNSTAKKYGCNKVALGHHSDDLIETFFMSMFYEGRLSTFQPNTYLSNTDITVIRPFLFVDEKQIETEKHQLPVFSNPCPANHNTTREKIKKFVSSLETNYERKNILNAIVEADRYNLFNNTKK